MSWLEWFAATLVIINLILIARRSLWNYPFGIAAAGAYFFVFEQAKLYSGAILQIFFIAVQIYGWWNWRRAITAGELPVGIMTTRARYVWLAGSASAAVLWGGMMSVVSDARLPFVDAALSSASVASQALVALRRVEGWAIWVGVNIAAIALFASQRLYATAGLYVILLALSVVGLRAWKAAAATRNA